MIVCNFVDVLIAQDRRLLHFQNSFSFPSLLSFVLASSYRSIVFIPLSVTDNLLQIQYYVACLYHFYRRLRLLQPRLIGLRLSDGQTKSASLIQLIPWSLLCWRGC